MTDQNPLKPRRRLWLSRLTSIGAVPDGDNPPAAIVLWKSKRDFPQEAREDMAERGIAMPDGSYPIPDKDALRRAIQSFGRASNPGAVRAHIIRRARALGASDMLPDDWQQKGVDVVPEDELEKEMADAVEAGPDAAETEAAPAEDDIAKRAEDEIRKAREERDAAVKALADEVAKRRQTEFAQKAAQLEPLLGPADATAPLLDTLESADPAAYAELENRLRVALSRVTVGKELGTAEGSADPLARRDVWVRKFLTDHPEQTEATARALFWKTNPDALEALRKDES